MAQITAATDADFQNAASLIPANIDLFKAFTLVESRGNGFNAYAAPTMLVEPHIIWKYATMKERAILAPLHLAYPKPGQYPYGSYADQYTKFNQIAALTRKELAILGTSFGLFQIMGFNFKGCGYPSALVFYQAMCAGERNQLTAAAILMRSFGMAEAFAHRDFAALALKWNGSGNVAAYSQKLHTAYQLEMQKASGVVTNAPAPVAPSAPVSGVKLSLFDWFLYGIALGMAQAKLK